MNETEYKALSDLLGGLSDSYGKSALQRAVQRRNLWAVKMLVDNLGEDIQAMSKDIIERDWVEGLNYYMRKNTLSKRDAFLCAVRCDAIECVKWLLETYDIDINAADNNVTPFIAALSHTASKVAPYLLEKGINIKVCPNETFAAGCEWYCEFVRGTMLVLADVVDVTTENLYHAFKASVELGEVLLKRGANINATFHSVPLLFHITSFEPRFRASLRHFIDTHHLDIHATNERGENTAQHLLLRYEYDGLRTTRDCVLALVSLPDFNIEHEDEKGNTLLFYLTPDMYDDCASVVLALERRNCKLHHRNRLGLLFYEHHHMNEDLDRKAYRGIVEEWFDVGKLPANAPALPWKRTIRSCSII